MVSKSNSDRIISTLRFECFDYVLPLNHSGGIWVLWNETNIMANVLLKEPRAIHMLIFDSSVQKLFVVSATKS